ncbi:MAG: 6-phospho-beta-glucosidase [Spirochaetia bacterium]|nr:6-phospho-beta-glucosidase [Spirochaetia bacterium]
MSGLHIAIIGAGSTYTPELIDGFIGRKDEIPVELISLMDIDREKLRITGEMTIRMLNHAGMKTRVKTVFTYEEAVKGADFVLGQIRVGKLPARVLDERIPLKYGLIGQETTGIGGLMKALRTIPVMGEIAECIERVNPNTWFINFSNPSGIIAEYLLNYTSVKMMGLCNVPINMKREVLAELPDSGKGVYIEYIGLNHLSWVTGVWRANAIWGADAAGIGREDFLPLLLERGNSLISLSNVTGSDFDETLLRAINAVPSPYLQYYYMRRKQLEHLLQEKQTRGEVCIDIERELIALYQDASIVEKPAVLDQRGGHLYSEAAVALVSAIANDTHEVHTVDVKNNGALPFMDNNDVVEIDCEISSEGASPLPIENFTNDHIIDLMRTVKSFERHAVKAGVTGDYREVVKALLIHPLMGDFDSAKKCFDELLEAHKEYLPQFEV